MDRLAEKVQSFLNAPPLTFVSASLHLCDPPSATLLCTPLLNPLDITLEFVRFPWLHIGPKDLISNYDVLGM